MQTLPLLSTHRMSLLPSPLKSPVSDRPGQRRCPNRHPDVILTVVHQPDATCRWYRANRMSLVPSPLKSPVPTTDQAAGSCRGQRPADWPPLINQTDTSPLVLLPENVGVAVAVEVAGAGDRPGDRHGAEVDADRTVRSRSSARSSIRRRRLRHRMSPYPSPLKSPVPTTDHLDPGCRSPLRLDRVHRSSSQIAMLPLPSRQRTSAVPSPLKSRWPTIAQPFPTLAKSEACKICVPSSATSQHQYRYRARECRSCRHR